MRQLASTLSSVFLLVVKGSLLRVLCNRFFFISRDMSTAHVLRAFFCFSPCCLATYFLHFDGSLYAFLFISYFRRQRRQCPLTETVTRAGRRSMETRARICLKLSESKFLQVSDCHFRGGGPDIRWIVLSGGGPDVRAHVDDWMLLTSWCRLLVLV